jgi:hypothetical protein
MASRWVRNTDCAPTLSNTCQPFLNGPDFDNCHRLRFAFSELCVYVHLIVTPQAVVTFGVMTDKLLALSVEPSLTILHKHTHTHQHELVAALHAAVERIEKRAQADVVEVPALPAGRRVTTRRNAAQKAG